MSHQLVLMKLWTRIIETHYFGAALSHSAIAQQEAEIAVAKLMSQQYNNLFTVNVSGPPSTGKTSLINKIAAELKLKGYSVAVLREEDELISRSLRLENSLSGINPLAFD